MKQKIGFGSFCVQEQTEQRLTQPHQLPIYATSSFAFETVEEGMDIFKGRKEGHVYSRFGNPTVNTVADKITQLETFGLDLEAKGILFSSGMAAIHTLLLSVLKTGDKILTHGGLYGGTTELLKKVLSPFGVETLFCDLKDLDAVEQQLSSDKAIRLLFFETPANPTMACLDMEAIAAVAQKHQVLTAADNTFCTPYIQQPFQYGIDYIIHSTTKFLNGHGNSIAGILIGKDVEFMQGKVFQTMKLSGPNCNPWDAWLVNNGLKTLEIRMERHSANAMAVAKYLAQHPQISRVNYNGLEDHPDHEIAKKQMRLFGGMLSFEIAAGLEASVDFMNKIEFCTLAPTHGDVDTLILHPASMSHINIPRETRMANGITDGLIRLSVGIENVEDILSDLEQALA